MCRKHTFYEYLCTLMIVNVCWVLCIKFQKILTCHVIFTPYLSIVVIFLKCLWDIPDKILSVLIFMLSCVSFTIYHHLPLCHWWLLDMATIWLYYIKCQRCYWILPTINILHGDIITLYSFLENCIWDMAFTAIGKYFALSETIAVCMDILHFVHDMPAGFISRHWGYTDDTGGWYLSN